MDRNVMDGGGQSISICFQWLPASHKIATTSGHVIVLSVPSARKQRLFVIIFRNSEPAEGRMKTSTSPLAGSKL